MAEVLESHIRETFDRNDCYSREVSQSVDDTIELVEPLLIAESITILRKSER